MNDIEILERYINGKDTMKESLVRAIENLLKRNKELEAKNKELNMLLSQFPDTTETYKKESDELLKTS